MTQPLVVSLLVNAETAGAKASVESVVAEVAGMGPAVQASTRTATGGMAQFDSAIAGTVVQTSAFSTQLGATETALGRVQAAVAGTTTGIGGQSAAVAEAARESAAWQASLASVRAQFNPLFAASRQYETELGRIADAEQIGAISAREAAAARDMAAARMAPLNQGFRNGAGAMKLQAHEARNLSYQLNDVFQSILLGMPPQQILLQQGPQITQIYGGVGNTFRALTRTLTPLRIGLGLTAGAAALLGSAYVSHLKSTKALETASKGLGRAVAGTAREMEASARAGAAAADIATGAARDMQVQFLRTGKIGSENFAGLIGLSKDFAATIGIGAEDAGKALADMFSDPAKAADEFYNRYGLIDGATARHAANLAAQNRVSEAQAVLIEALPDRLARATEATTALGRAWEGVATGASNAFDAIGSAIDRALNGETAEEELTRLRGLIENVPRRPSAQRAFEAANAPRIAELEALLAKQQADRERAAAERRGAVAVGIAGKSDANRDSLRREELQNRLVALKDGLGAPGLDSTQRQRIERAIQATSNALDGLNAKRANEIELDRIAIQLQTARDPLLRAELEARKTRLTLADREMTTAEKDIEVQRARARVLDEAVGTARAQAGDMRAEIGLRARLAAGVANGTLTTAEANRLLQEEAQLRPLVAAAAQAEGDEKIRLLTVIEDLRGGYGALAEAQAALGQAEALRRQDEQLARLRLEAELAGQGSAARERAIAIFEAELDLRQRGIALDSAEADRFRQRAVDLADYRRGVDRVREAWDQVREAAEGAIDGPVDALLQGDLSGAIDSFAKEITGLFADIAIRNPIKNALLGSDYPTITDVGGLRGIGAWLAGGGSTATGGGIAQSVGQMQVAAGTVIIGGAGATALFGGAGPDGLTAANAGTAPGGGLAGGADVQSQIWRFFAGKGLQPHQIAAILGNVSAESGFDPRAKGDGGNAFGLFQWNDRRHDLFDFIGGQQNLGDIGKQLEFAWHELLTSENGPLKRLMQAPDLYSATHAFTGFERPSGYNPAQPTAADGWDRRLAAAEAALARFGTTASDATLNLGTLGQGFDVFGTALANGLSGLASGGAQGGLTDFFGTLITGLAAEIGLPGFATGGPTGGTSTDEVRGVVHGREYVFDAAATARIGVRTLDALRKGDVKGYREGGYVIAGATLPAARAGAAPAASGTAPVSIVVNDYAGAKVEAQETADSQGGRQLIMTIGDMQAAALAQPGNPLPRALQAQYGLKRQGTRR